MEALLHVARGHVQSDDQLSDSCSVSVLVFADVLQNGRGQFHFDADGVIQLYSGNLLVQWQPVDNWMLPVCRTVGCLIELPNLVLKLGWMHSMQIWPLTMALPTSFPLLSKERSLLTSGLSPKIIILLNRGINHWRWMSSQLLHGSPSHKTPSRVDYSYASFVRVQHPIPNFSSHSGWLDCRNFKHAS
jgi:hypothetical protein